jgi:hypothetical protein
MSFYTFVSFVSALASVAQAKDNDDVKYALEILNDLPADLAEPFCGTFGGQQYGGATSTYTITAAPITITTTTPCSSEYSQDPYAPNYPPYSPIASDEYYPGYTTTTDEYDSPDYTPYPSEEDYPPYFPEPTEDADPIYADESSYGGGRPTVIYDPTYSSADLPIYTSLPSGIADPEMTDEPTTFVDATSTQTVTTIQCVYICSMIRSWLTHIELPL